MNNIQGGKSETAVLRSTRGVRGSTRGVRGKYKEVRGEYKRSTREHGNLAFSPLIIYHK